MDASPTKAWLVGQRNAVRWKWHYDYDFGKRPSEQLFDLRQDPDQTVNVAANPKYAKTRAEMAKRLMDELKRTNDPRLVDGGRFFKSPPMTDLVTPGAAAKKKAKKRQTGRRRSAILWSFNSPGPRRQNMRRFLFMLSIILFPVSSVCAQSAQASISGVVTDKQGAVIPNAEVTATELQTGAKTVSRTNEAAFYSLRPLPIGGYLVTAEYSGFRRHERRGIAVTTGQALELNITLEIGALTDSIAVTAEAPLLETRNSEASQLIESQTIADMPLGDRRAHPEPDVLDRRRDGAEYAAGNRTGRR